MINDIGYLFRNLTVIKNDKNNGNILILNPKDYERFHEQFKDYGVKENE